MNLQPVTIPGEYAHLYFTTTCIRCSTPLFCTDAKADRDGCPFRSYYCPACAQRVTSEEAVKLAAIARRLIHTNA